MTSVKKAIWWATMIIVVAAAGRFGVIDQGSRTTLLIALPVAAWMALSGRTGCALWRKA